MKSLLKLAARETVSQTLHLAPTAFWRRLFPKSAVGVCYHVVSDRPLAHVKHYRFLGRADFEADLRYLQSRFGFISYAELAERRMSSSAVRDNAAILTFDDGFAECFTEVTPVLRRLGLTGIFFLITDLIDNTTIFRESTAALCIEKIRERPVELILEMVAEQTARVRAIMADARKGADPKDAIAAWSAPRQTAVARARAVIDDIEAAGGWSFAKLTIANAALKAASAQPPA